VEERFCKFSVVEGPKGKPLLWHEAVGEYAFCKANGVTCGDTNCAPFYLQGEIDRHLGTNVLTVVSTNETCKDCDGLMSPKCVDTTTVTGFTPPALEAPTCKTSEKLSRVGPGPLSVCMPSDSASCNGVHCGLDSSIYSCDAANECLMDVTKMFAGTRPAEIPVDTTYYHPPPPPPGGEATSCFAAATTTACRLAEGVSDAEAAFQACYEVAEPALADRVLMSQLAVGDRVLTATDGELAITSVVVNQHASEHVTSAMVNVRTADGTTLSMTPDHALLVDGKFAAASTAKVGTSLVNARGRAVRITRVDVLNEAKVINPVTTTGTILASDNGAPVLAASHPIWIAPLVASSSTVRGIVNAALAYVGDVPSVSAGVRLALAKAASTVIVLNVASKALRRSSP